MSAYVNDRGVLSELVRTLPADVPMAARYAYALLVNHAGPDCVAWPSRSTLAAEMGANPATAYRAVKELRDRGLLAVTPGDGRRSSVYRFVDYRDPAELSTGAAVARPLNTTRGRASAAPGAAVDATRGRGSAARSNKGRSIEERAHDPLAVDDPVAAATAAQEFFASIQRPRMTEAERNAAGARAWARARARFTDAPQT